MADSSRGRCRPPRAAGAAAAVVVAALVVAGCAGRRPLPPPPPSAAERAYPALVWVPADAPWALVGTRAADLAAQVRVLLDLAAVAGFLGVPSATELDRRLTAYLGGSPLDVEDLLGAGLDPAAGAALFGQEGGLPTAVFAVRDAARLAGFLDARRPEVAPTSTLRHGHELFTWRPAGDLGVAWVVLDGWLVAHLLGPGGATGAVDDGAWFDALMAAAAGRALGDAPDLAAALAAGRALADGTGAGSPAALGVVRPALLARELAAALGAGPCTTFALGAASEVAFASASAPGGVDGVELVVTLEPAAAATLAEAIGPPPRPGMVGFRREAGLHAGLTVDLERIDRAARAAGCPLALASRDPVRRATGGTVRGFYVAIQDLDLADGSGRAMAQLALAGAGFVEGLLDAIPGRSFLERRRTVAGVEVRSVGGIAGLPRLSYRLTDRELVAALGDGAIERLLGPGDGAARGGDGRELAALGVQPARLRDPAALLAAAGVGVDPALLAAALDGLGRGGALDVRASLDGDRLRLRGELRRRR